MFCLMISQISAEKSEVKGKNFSLKTGLNLYIFQISVLPSTSDEDYYDVNVSTEAPEESSVTHYSNPS